MSQVVLTRSQLSQIAEAAIGNATKPPVRSPDSSPTSPVIDLSSSLLSSTAIEYSTSLNRQRDNDIMSALADIKQIVRGLDKKFSDNIDDLKQSVAAVKDEVAAVRQDVSNLVASQITEHGDRLDSHDTRLDAVEASIRELNNNVEAATKSADLIIRGVPMLPNENVVKLYVDIAAAIGYDNATTPSAENIIRLGKQTPGGKFDPPLLVKFARVSDKTEFFRRYFHHNRLNLLEIGFNADRRIYINENLTKLDQQIHAAAMKLRHEKKLHSVSTSRGVVMVRLHKEDRPVPVKAVSELTDLIDDGA